jgi:hypothetical protein
VRYGTMRTLFLIFKIVVNPIPFQKPFKNRFTPVNNTYTLDRMGLFMVGVASLHLHEGFKAGLICTMVCISLMFLYVSWVVCMYLIAEVWSYWQTKPSTDVHNCNHFDSIYIATAKNGQIWLFVTNLTDGYRKLQKSSFIWIFCDYLWPCLFLYFTSVINRLSYIGCCRTNNFQYHFCF